MIITRVAITMIYWSILFQALTRQFCARYYYSSLGQRRENVSTKDKNWVMEENSYFPGITSLNGLLQPINYLNSDYLCLSFLLKMNTADLSLSV